MQKLAFVALMFAAACGTSIQETQINPAPRTMAPRAPESVEVFSSGQPQRPHVDVAYLEAEQSSGFSVDNTPDFITKLRVRAAARGCDAIVLGSVTNHLDGGGRYASNQKGILATCVVYTQ
jgi:hypothetical protein